MKVFQQVLYGTSKQLIFLRSREIINECLSTGFEVRYLDGKKSKKAEISEALSVGLFDVDSKLVVLENYSGSVNLDPLLNQDSISVLYLINGVIPKALIGLKKKENFEEPKSLLKKQKWCAKYFQTLVKGEGKEISLPICESVVQRVGLDLGVLRYEALKLGHVGDGDELTAKEVLSVLAPLSEMSGFLLVDAVFSQNPTHFLKVCSRYEKRLKKDPTISICQGLLFKNLMDVLSVRFCFDLGFKSSQQISDKIGKEKWLVESILIPRAKTYTTKKVQEILGLLYHCENQAFRGVVSPFTAFKSGMVRLMIS